MNEKLAQAWVNEVLREDTAPMSTDQRDSVKLQPPQKLEKLADLAAEFGYSFAANNQKALSFFATLPVPTCKPAALCIDILRAIITSGEQNQARKETLNLPSSINLLRAILAASEDPTSVLRLALLIRKLVRRGIQGNKDELFELASQAAADGERLRLLSEEPSLRETHPHVFQDIPVLDQEQLRSAVWVCSILTAFTDAVKAVISSPQEDHIPGQLCIKEGLQTLHEDVAAKAGRFSPSTIGKILGEQ